MSYSAAAGHHTRKSAIFGSTEFRHKSGSLFYDSVSGQRFIFGDFMNVAAAIDAGSITIFGTMLLGGPGPNLTQPNSIASRRRY